MERPKVGIAVIIFKEGKILLGKRKNAHGAGSWAPPGGHLEYGESFEQCAVREVAEETGLVIQNVRQAITTNDLFIFEKQHYITIFMVADYKSGVPQVLEPDKCDIWSWFNRSALPVELFLSLKNALIKHDGNFFETQKDACLL